MTDFNAITPIVIVLLSAVTVMLLEAFRQRGERLSVAGLAAIGPVGAVVACVLLWNRDLTGFSVVRADNFALFMTIVVAIVGLLTILFSSQVVERDELPAGDYYALTMFAVAGMMLMVAATDLLVIYLALEIMSLSIYILTAIQRNSVRGAEAAFKYYLLGAFSSAFFLYGIAFTYAVTGSTRLDRIGVVMAAHAMSGSPVILLAVGLLLVGFAFKVSAVPFHMWAPDVYEGAPTVVTGFMSTGVKAAAFGAFVRVFLSAFDPLRGDWGPVLWLIAAATMILGAVVGVAQTNVKRMLAYSSIAHAGYLLVGIVAGSAMGKAAMLFYLLAYAVTNLGAFGVIAFIARRDRQNETLDDFRGLWNTQPVLAALMTVFLISLGGLPPTAGFIGKWYIFSAAVQSGYYALAIIGVLTSVVSVFFYLRIVVMMYMTEPSEAVAVSTPSVTGLAILTLAVLGIFYLGVLPARVLEIAAESVRTVF